MVLKIDDELLKRLHLTEQDICIEVFARLFDQGKLSFARAADLAGITQDQMYEEIEKRGIPRHRYTPEMYQQDLRAIEHMKRLDGADSK